MKQDMAKAAEANLIAAGADKLQIQAAYDERQRLADAAHQAELARARAELEALRSASDDARTQQVLAEASHRNAAIRRASKVVRALRFREAADALREWQKNVALGKQAAAVQAQIEKLQQQVDEPKDQLELFMAEKMREVQEAEKRLKAAEQEAQKQQQRAKQELEAKMAQSEAREVALQKALTDKENEAQRHKERFEKHAAMAAEKEKEAKRQAAEALASAKAQAEAEVQAAREKMEANQASMTQDAKAKLAAELARAEQALPPCKLTSLSNCPPHT